MTTEHSRTTAIRVYGSAILAAVFVIEILTILGISRSQSPTPLPTADTVLVIKHAHTLTLFHDGQLIKQYRVALDRGGLGPKQ